MNKDETMTSILWRRLRYMLSPQADLYRSISDYIYKNYVSPSIIEIGSGTGFGTLQLAVSAGQVDACEPDREAWKFSITNIPHKDITWRNLSILDEHFTKIEPHWEICVMIETLEHIQDWEQALSNIHKVLFPGGVLIMTARNANADLRRNDLHEREWSSQELYHNLSRWFKKVELFDYRMTEPCSNETRITPLIAVAQK